MPAVARECFTGGSLSLPGRRGPWCCGCCLACILPSRQPSEPLSTPSLSAFAPPFSFAPFLLASTPASPELLFSRAPAASPTICPFHWSKGVNRLPQWHSCVCVCGVTSLVSVVPRVGPTPNSDTCANRTPPRPCCLLAWAAQSSAVREAGCPRLCDLEWCFLAVEKWIEASWSWSRRRRP